MARMDEPLEPNVIACWQRMTSVQKLSTMFEANETARQLSAAGVRQLYPSWSSEQVEAEVGRRFLRAATRIDASHD